MVQSDGSRGAARGCVWAVTLPSWALGQNCPSHTMQSADVVWTRSSASHLFQSTEGLVFPLPYYQIKSWSLSCRKHKIRVLWLVQWKWDLGPIPGPNRSHIAEFNLPGSAVPV